MIVELPHHKGGPGITPLKASGMAAFYRAPGRGAIGRPCAPRPGKEAVAVHLCREPRRHRPCTFSTNHQRKHACAGSAGVPSATAQLVSLLHSLPHASECDAGQNLADCNTWNSSALQTLKQLHDKLLTHYNCTEWAPPRLQMPMCLTLLLRDTTTTMLALFPFFH
jgi:hypothetical protein